MIGGLLLGLAIGAGVGIWLGRSMAPAAPPEAPPGPRVKGVEPEKMWALERGQWVRMQRTGELWHPEERLAPSQQPVRLDFPPVLQWAAGVGQDPQVIDALEGWTRAVVAASQVGWVTGIPAGDHLVGAWASLAEPTEDPARDFGRWLVAELGKAGRKGLTGRTIADQRGAVIRRLHQAAGRLVEALEPQLALELDPPGGVGPRQQESWLADVELSKLLDNPPVGDVVQPVVVLRPKLLREETVLMEGEVA